MPVLAPFEKIAMEKGRQEGRQEGWQEGRQEGIEHGELLEAQSTLLDILGYRFAPLPDRLKEHIQNMEDISKVRNLRKQSLKVQSLRDFERLITESGGN